MSDLLGNGLGPTPNGSPGSGSLVAFPWEVFTTQEIDLTLPVSNMELVPARPGHVPNCVQALFNRFVITKTSGVQTVPLSARAGSDVGHSNFLALSATNPTNADVNGANPPSLSTGGLSAAAAGSQVIPNATVFFDVVTGAQGTGNFVLRGKFVVAVTWAAVG